jgi:hypothetical protein
MFSGDAGHRLGPPGLLCLYKVFRMESSKRDKKNELKPHPHRTDEKHPDIFLNVDLVRKHKPEDHTAPKACTHCCDECKSKAKKEGRNQMPPFDN